VIRAVAALALLALTACGSATPAPPAPSVPAGGGLVQNDGGPPIHLHAHLDVFVDGRLVRVPAEVGGRGELRTEDDSGVLHIESTVDRHFTLAAFFSLWRRPFTGSSVYVDGAPYAGSPAALLLRDHQEIAVVYGALPAGGVPVDYSFND
jgi:hypothetical protein